MFYQYDQHGCFAGTSETLVERATETPPGELNPNWNWNGVSWVFFPESQIPKAPVITAALPAPAVIALPAKQQKLADLAALRYEKETAGITLNGTMIRTDEYSQGKVNGAWSTAQINPAVLIDFKGVNGWVKLNAAEITAIAEAVSIHIQACFSAERVHSEAITALEDDAAITAYDITTGWPA